jgi:hypothetical protein
VFTTELLKGDTEVGHQGGTCTVTSVQRNEGRIQHARGVLAAGRGWCSSPGRCH